VMAPSKMESMLKSNELDLAISDSTQIHAAPSATWLVPLQWAARGDMHIDKTRTLPLVLLDTPCSWRDEVLNSLRNHGWEWRTTFESSSLDAVTSATQSGLGVTTLPMDVIRKSKLGCVSNAGLPLLPGIQFGIYSATALRAIARIALEVAIGAIAEAEKPREC
jgi:DNA-binding transcriptional LysR family regulator